MIQVLDVKENKLGILYGLNNVLIKFWTTQKWGLLKYYVYTSYFWKCVMRFDLTSNPIDVCDKYLSLQLFEFVLLKKNYLMKMIRISCFQISLQILLNRTLDLNHHWYKRRATNFGKHTPSWCYCHRGWTNSFLRFGCANGRIFHFSHAISAFRKVISWSHGVHVVKKHQIIKDLSWRGFFNSS